MKLKITFSIICFCLLINCNDTDKTKKDKPINSITQQKDCINNILKQDDSLGTIRNHACETISLSQTIKQYVNSIHKLNFENCPDNFEQAFKNHASAWTEIQKLSNNYSNLRGEMHTIFDKIEKTEDSTNFKQLLKNIWDTWKTVEEVKSAAERF